MKYILFLVSFAFIANLNAQKINGQINFPKGKKLEVVSEIKAIVTQEMMGQEMEMNVNTTIERSLDIENVSNGNATVEHKVKRIQMNFDSPMGAQTFDSENEKDMKGDAGKTLEKSLKNKYTMTIDNTGKIIAVKADDDNPNEKKDANDPMSGAMAQYAEGLQVPNVNDFTDLKILPNREISKGETWTDSLNESKFIYTLSDIRENDVVVDYTETAKISRKQEMMGMEISITSNDKTTGKIIVDRKSGLMKEKTSTTVSDGTTEVMGQSIPTTSKTTRTITVKGF
ncbi:MAG: DUF6263 family protein [Bacteroidota bacterium]|jgi:hypothetical protein|nr:hypothetical protein [Flavisolibacter sp.]MDQ3552196.1 DUF6263 family protein [Bacteroidota bacterium]